MKALLLYLFPTVIAGFLILAPLTGATQSLQNDNCDNCFLPLGSDLRPEAAIDELKGKIGQSLPGKSSESDSVRIRLANLFTQLGRYDDAAKLLAPLFWGFSSDSEITAVARVLWCLLWADIARSKGEALDSFNQITTANLYLQQVTSPKTLAALSRIIKRERFARAVELVPLADDLDQISSSTTGNQGIPEDILFILHSTLIPEASRLVEGKVEIPPGQLKNLEAFRPWKDALLRTANILAIELKDLDQLVLENTELVGALQMNREADLCSVRGKPREAIHLRQRAIATFQHLGNKDLQMEALAGIEKDGLKTASIDSMLAVFPYGRQLILFHEERMARLGSDSYLYQKRHIDAYMVHRDLLFRLAKDATQLPGQMKSFILQELVLHSDRIQLRPIRREMAILRTMTSKEEARKRVSAEVAAVKHKLNAAASSLTSAQNAGISRENLRSKAEDVRTLEAINKAAPGDTIVFESGTVSAGKEMSAETGGYVKMIVAQKDIRHTVDTTALANISLTKEAVELPTAWDGLIAGMTENDAIIMFIGSGFDFESPLKAVIITNSSTPRIVHLPGATLKEISVLVASAIENLSTNSSRQSTAVEELARLLWHPLGSLPNHLTIVPNLQLIGLPFEVLPTLGGGAVIDTHSVRYAIGLVNGIGCQKVIPRPSTALIIGAEEFQRLQLDPLAEVRLEVDAVRRLMQDAHVPVVPNDSFPRTGVAMLSAAPNVGIIHISTHSIRDANDTLFDRLAFPDEDILGVDLALSPLRADITVFSACGLFQNREKGTQPVSGVITASLATISPQVVTTLWSVESQSTRIFMSVFYERLIESGIPAIALAETKKMFRFPAQLKAWALKHGMQAVDLNRLSSPYYWAAFALAVLPDVVK